ncbi:uncharacterized protein JN550_003880 [Neoarthrinium moseri]|uniref:uncharacterized protein n=1 Tax=Neoarthrinium moseri TaxID=1658444 RepID=UPI001FDDA992|nr:uncharacterized protein JN550_003880 [Neoarthrinium moseri]KAI1872161.1 hypothetical protein JN550_003880 [Neoarthrinium moseri]
MVSVRDICVFSLVSGLVSADGLSSRAKAAGKLYWGTAINPNVLNDASAKAIGTNSQDFGSFTCENEMKFDATEPSRVTNGNFDNATMISIMKNHITNVMTHFKGKCYAWDVVNEALAENGGYRTDSAWYKAIGPAFIPIAFAHAATVDPSAKLYYNDYNCDVPGSKSTGAQNLIKTIRAYGARVDGMGLQGHMSVGNVNQANLISNLNAFAALNVEVAYTELDINTPAPGTSSTLEQQAKDYASVVNACKAVSKCVGITQWGVADKYTWISGGAPLPWNSALAKKPAYTSALNAWGSGGGTPTTTTLATTTTKAPSTTTTAGGGSGGCTVARYGQCGGSGYSGCTTCASGSSCSYSNDYYSQCL